MVVNFKKKLNQVFHSFKCDGVLCSFETDARYCLNML